jgi:hypothetical protein
MKPLLDDLRSWIPGAGPAGGPAKFWRGERHMSDACLEAADEIERLTRELAESNEALDDACKNVAIEDAEAGRLRAALEEANKRLRQYGLTEVRGAGDSDGPR